jgi:sarcosine oxidase subunit beta
MFLKRPVGLAQSHVALIDDIQSQYFRPEIGQLTLGGLEDGNAVGIDPDCYRESIDTAFVLTAGARLSRRMPGMLDARLVRGQAGCDGLTPDQHAILGQAGPDGFYVAVGHSGTGFKLAPAIGACIAELIAEGKPRTADLTPFRYTRYAEAKPLVGQYPYGELWKDLTHADAVD